MGEARPGVVLGDTFLEREHLLARAAKAAGGFAALGVGAGDAVALLMRNDFPFFEATFGAANLGAYTVPFNWHATAQEVAYLVRDCGARVLVGHADLLDGVRDAIPEGVTVLAAETPLALRSAYHVDAKRCAVRPWMTAWDTWLERQPMWQGTPPATAETIIYTSGTTGRPKGVRRQPPTAEQLPFIEKARREIYGIKPGIRTVLPGPLYHSAPNAFGVRASRIADLLVLMPRFDAEELLRLIERHRIDTLLMVPTMFVRLLKLPAAVRRRYDLSSLKFVVHAAAPCPIDVKRAMIEWWGPIIVEFYGGTESGAVSFCTSDEWLAHPGTVGRIVDDAVLRILGDDGREAPRGVPGEIYMRLGYFPDFTYQGQDEKRREIERDGLITLGDIGYVDDDNFLYLCDRKRDMAIIGGTNVYPAEIEAVLVGMPGVKDCAVFGIPDEDYGEVLMALVEPQPGAALDPAAVRKFLKGYFTGFKLPRQVEIHAGLPREDSGKIFKRKLRAPYWEKVGRRI
ncbi:MAG TPA: acyl-CoA synthetase [Stellaceae bacterium]|nr:acyl-CoA synthetase [Stellaceae bacterium]